MRHIKTKSRTPACARARRIPAPAPAQSPAQSQSIDDLFAGALFFAPGRAPYWGERA